MPIEHLKPGQFFDEERSAALKALAPEAFADGKINWPDKRDARRLAGKPSTGTLVPANLRRRLHRTPPWPVRFEIQHGSREDQLTWL